jgi:hypothetical protein
VRKQKEVKEISEEANEVRSARVARDGVGSGAADVHWQTRDGRDPRLVTRDDLALVTGVEAVVCG